MTSALAQDVVVDGTTYRVAIQKGPGATWSDVENQLNAAGLPLPLYHQVDWTSMSGARDNWFVATYDSDSVPLSGFGVQVHHSRALPGHRILRLEKLGLHFDASPLIAGVLALREHIEKARVLRLDVELFARSDGVRDRLGQALAANGFRRAQARIYTDTPVIDLLPDEANILAGFHATARRHIRAADKHPVSVRCVADEQYAPRLESLLRETMGRTGGAVEHRDWSAMIRFCNDNPGKARLIGLFRDDATGVEGLLAYALGISHGTHVEYLTAASTRDATIRIPLAYALAWDLIRWAKSTDAKWFDFGGINTADDAANDPTAGIADFKRYFTRNVIRVGEVWSCEPLRIRAALARVASAAVSSLNSNGGKK